MSKKILAVADSDPGYVDRFLKYVKKKKNLPFTALGFTSVRSLQQYLERNRADVLLVSSELADEEQIRFLRGQSGNCEILISGDRSVTENGQQYINKYRLADQVLADVTAVCSPEGMETIQVLLQEVDMTAVYSPVCLMERQDFAVAVAGRLSRDKNILLLSLDRFSGLKTVLQAQSEYSFSDLLFFFQTNPKRIKEVLQDAVVKTNVFDLLLAPDTPEDLDLVEEEKWGVLFRLLMDCGGYDEIVLDMGDSFRKPEILFSLCSHIFVPVTEQGLYTERIQEFKNYMEMKDCECFPERLTEVILPLPEKNSSAGEGNTDYIRHCMEGTWMKAVEDVFARVGKPG